ncbi:MAG: SDR family oxidoreductase [Gammaproteobacteria bacterium]|nr:SDR family oxidoreductase [Gammaproteobacteria bacterium]NVK88145.1 SDR family oxidoreductase [Gammaproteobacteria bacterium]
MRPSALVTGGAIRIGRAIVEYLASRDYPVIVHYSGSQQAAESLAEQLRSAQAKVCLVQADLTATAGPQLLLEQIPAEFQNIELLVNSAAIFPEQDQLGTIAQQWEAVMALNARAPLFLTEAVWQHSPSLKQVINIVDARIQRNQKERLCYRWSKQLLAHATSDLALAMAPNVRVNALALGAILPPPGCDEGYLNRLQTNIPLAQVGDRQQVVNAIGYLLDQPFVTGQILALDGGEFL